VYSLSPNYPEALAANTDEIVLDWDVLLKDTAAAARGQTVDQLVEDL
jgi:hypothetical protein